MRLRETKINTKTIEKRKKYFELRKLQKYTDPEEYQKAIEFFERDEMLPNKIEDQSPNYIEKNLFLNEFHVNIGLKRHYAWNFKKSKQLQSTYKINHERWISLGSPHLEQFPKNDFDYTDRQNAFRKKYNITIEEYEEYFLFYQTTFKKYQWIYNKISDLISYYMEIMRTDQYCKQYYPNKNLIKFAFADGRTLFEHASDEELNIDYYEDASNIFIYSTTNIRETNKPRIDKFENITKAFDKRMTAREYDMEIDILSACRFQHETLEEIFTDMNTRGYMQGNFRPRYPAKYIKDPIELQNILFSSREKEKNFIKYIESELEKEPQKAVAIKKKATSVNTFNKFNSDKITYRSSLELLAFNFLDTTPNILAWSSETIIVPYIKPQDNKIHRYFVDLWVMVKQQDGSVQTFLIEIKPKSQCLKPRKTARKSEKTYLTEMLTYATNQAKWSYAKKFAEDNDMKFMIWTEKDLSL